MKRIVIHGCTGFVLLSLIVTGIALAEPSEIDNGKKVYEKKRCGLCHAIGGQGGKIGPDLSSVGNRRDGDWLKKFLKDPKGTVPGARMSPVKASEQDLSALTAYLLSLKK